MTDYEKHVLALLAVIARGISLQLQQATLAGIQAHGGGTPEMQSQQIDNVKHWMQALDKILAGVQESISPDDPDDWGWLRRN